MNNKAKFLIIFSLLVAPFIFICLHSFLSLNWETCGGLVLIGVSIGNIALFSTHFTTKFDQVRRLVVLYTLVTLLLGVATTADGVWGSRWPLLDWAAGIAVLIQFVALKLLVRKLQRWLKETKSLEVQPREIR